ncbi:50S ribosomal protein L15 [Candidatus Peregrinibacteria bacterium]|nr:50S ribosomal protein L15 [Candidatus Peregrinibacteria bacterium]MBT7736586.1 50S ribosomal protein L15 [Candidatus Peregrinibacteria bacterium]
MPLINLKSNVKQPRKRVGRGNASGHGTYSCRGMKGQSARSGGRRRPGFEGGQTPYLRRMPKLKGFTNPNYVEYQVVNVGDLNVFDDKAEIKKEDLLKKNIISKKSAPVKLLGGKGDLEKAVTIHVDKASASAIEKVEAKKGKVIVAEVLPPRKSKKKEVKEEAPKKEEAKKEEKTETAE